MCTPWKFLESITPYFDKAINCMKTDWDALFLGDPSSIGQVEISPELKVFDSIKFKTFGKFYIGVATSKHDFSSNIGYDADSWALAFDGRIFHNSES